MCSAGLASQESLAQSETQELNVCNPARDSPVNAESSGCNLAVWLAESLTDTLMSSRVA